MLRETLMPHLALRATLVAGTMLLLAGQAAADRLVINANTSDPAPRAAFQEVVEQFPAAHPDIAVELDVFDHEGFETQLGNFLVAQTPDVITWFAGNRMKASSTASSWPTSVTSGQPRG
jgi:multiple sugar transport system substrate-binding protein